MTGNSVYQRFRTGFAPASDRSLLYAAESLGRPVSIRDSLLQPPRLVSIRYPLPARLKPPLFVV